MTDKQFEFATLQNRILHTKIYILDFDLNRIDEISGMVLDGATFTISADSDIRRTTSISIVPTDATFSVDEMSKIFIDKYIQIYIGLEVNKGNSIIKSNTLYPYKQLFSSKTLYSTKKDDEKSRLEDKNNVVYTNMGIYLVENPSVSYDATNNVLSISGIDMMAKLTGLRNGYVSAEGEAVTYQIPQGSNIINVMRATLRDLGHVNRYRLLDESELITKTVPNDLMFSMGATIYDMLSQLRDINANYQIYYDTNGVFNFSMIPSGEKEFIVADDKLWKQVLISYDMSVSFDDVKNYVEVYGKTDDYGHTPMGIAYDNNPESPFYIYGNAGIIRKVFQGGEYDNITGQGNPQTSYSSIEERMKDPVWQAYDTLAQQRANYELYLNCRLQDQVNITCVPVYWLDVNQLVELTLPNKQTGVEETHKYIIKNINTTLGVNGTQTITLMRYYPFYPLWT